MSTSTPMFFFHLPKTAGSSMQAVLSQHFAPGEIAAAVTWTTLLRQDRRKLSQNKLFQGHFYGPLEEIVGRRCFTFTILRDPIERALSHYGHVLRDEKHYLHRRTMELGSIEAYMDDPVTAMTISNFQSRMLALDFDVNAYFENLSDEDRNAWKLEQHIETADVSASGNDLLSAARTKLESFDVVGITERFHETLALLCYRRRWKYPTEMQVRNVNEKRIRRAGLDPRTLKRLKELNSIDMELYSAARTMFETSYSEMLAELVNSRARRSLRQLMFGQSNG